MSDAMDSDVREVIRRRIELRERDGHERLLLNHVDLRALLDAADERDRIKAEMGDPSRHYIMDGWLVIDTGKHTCGTGPGGHYGAHEPGCGLEQALRLDNLPGWPGDERDRLAAAVERVRALHRSVGIYDECDCPDDAKGEGHVDVYEVGMTCNKLYDICDGCCRSDGYQTEDCANYHEHKLGETHHCPTLRALDGTDDGTTP